MSDIAIRVEDLWKQYRIGHKKSASFRESIGQWFTKSEADYFWALKALDFEIKRGEAVGIIGKNGAGKSTLLKVLSKITYPTKGRIEINGRVSSLLEVGTGFHPELTGRQNVFLNGTILGMTRKEVATKFDEIVAFSGVEKFIDTPVKHYSSGMKVRLAFSVAAHLEPEILIIDEVLAVGDAEFQKKCLGKMEDVTSEGRTVLFVSHNMGAVKTMCITGINLVAGTVNRIGSIHRVIDEYLREDINNSKSRLTLNKKSKQGELTVKKIEICNLEGELRTEVLVGQAWTVAVEIISHCHMTDFVFALGIMTLDDVAVRTIYSDFTQIEMGQSYILSFQLDDVFLASSSYKLILGLSKGQEVLISVPEVAIIKIEEDILGNNYYRSNAKNGVVVNRGNTKVRIID